MRSRDTSSSASHVDREPARTRRSCDQPVRDAGGQEEPVGGVQLDVLAADDERGVACEQDDPFVVVLPVVDGRFEHAAEDLFDHDAAKLEQTLDGLARLGRRGGVAEMPAQPPFGHQRPIVLRDQGLTEEGAVVMCGPLLRREVKSDRGGVQQSSQSLVEAATLSDGLGVAATARLAGAAGASVGVLPGAVDVLPGFEKSIGSSPCAIRSAL